MATITNNRPPTLQQCTFYGHPDTTVDGSAWPMSSGGNRVQSLIIQHRNLVNEADAYYSAGMPGLAPLYVFAGQVGIGSGRWGWPSNQVSESESEIINAPKEAWLYRDKERTIRVTQSEENGVYAYPDPASSWWRTFHATKDIEFLNRYANVNAIFLDNIGEIQNIIDDGPVYSGTGEQYSITSYQNKEREFLQHLKDNVTVANGLNANKANWVLGGNFLYRGKPDYTLYSMCGILMNEDILGYTYVGHYKSVSDVDHNINSIRAWLNGDPGKRSLYAVMQLRTLTDRDYSQWGMGFALMCLPTNNPPSSWTIGGKTLTQDAVLYRPTRGDKYGVHLEFPELNIVLGKPTADPINVSPGIWTRVFEYGNVELNVNSGVRKTTINTTTAPNPTIGAVFRSPTNNSVISPEVSTGTQTLTYPKPSDLTIGDRIQLHAVQRKTNAATFTPPTGFALISEIKSDSSTVSRIYEKIAVLADTNAPNFPLTSNTYGAMVGEITSIGGIDPAAVPVVNIVKGTGATINYPNITPNQGKNIVLNYATALWGYATIAAPSGSTPRGGVRQGQPTPIELSTSVSSYEFLSNDGATQTTTRASTSDMTSAANWLAQTVSYKVAATSGLPTSTPSYVNSVTDSVAVSGDATFTPPLITGIQVGDWLESAVYWRNSGSIQYVGLTVPTNTGVWTKLGDRLEGFSANFVVYGKFATAADLNTTSNWVLSSNTVAGTISVTAYRGTNPDTPVQNLPLVIKKDSATAQMIFDSVNVTGNYCRVVAHGGLQSSGISSTVPSPWTERVDYTPVSAANYVADRDMGTTPGATGTLTATNSFTSSALTYYSTMVVLNPVNAGSPPTIPTNLTAALQSDNKTIRVNATVASGVKQVFIERSDNGSAYTLISTITPAQLPYDDKNLDPNKYHYRMFVGNEFGSSGYTGASSEVTVPSINSVSISLQGENPLFIEVKLNPFDFSSNVEVVIERSAGPTDDYESWYQGSITTLPNGILIDNSLDYTTRYVYRVKTITDNYESGWIVSNIITTPNKPIIVPPDFIPGYNPTGKFNVAVLYNGEWVSISDGEIAKIYSHSGLSIPRADRRKRKAPYQHGQSDRGFTLAPRQFNLGLSFDSINGVNINKKLGKVAKLFVPATDDVTFRVDAEGLTPKLIDAYLLDEPIEANVGNDIQQRVVYSFEADNPAFRGLYRQAVNINLGIGEGTEVPTSIPMSIGNTSLGLEIPVTYYGDIESNPEIVITGPITGLSITNTTTGESIEFSSDYAIEANRTVTIDTSEGFVQVIADNGEDLGKYLTSTSSLSSFTFKPASEVAEGVNMIKVSGKNATSNTRVYFGYFEYFTSYYSESEGDRNV